MWCLCIHRYIGVTYPSVEILHGGKKKGVLGMIHEIGRGECTRVIYGGGKGNCQDNYIVIV